MKLFKKEGKDERIVKQKKKDEERNKTSK